MIKNKKRKRKDTTSKLAYPFLYANTDKKKKDSPEKKTWQQINGHDLSNLILKGWTLDRLTQHYHLPNIAIIEKLRWNWKMPEQTIYHKFSSRKQPPTKYPAPEF